MKKSSTFYSSIVMDRIKSNIEKYDFASDIKREFVREAEPWVNFSDDQLWNFVFGNTIKRSWMVWSSGYCPSCKNDVPMYTWEVDPLSYQWKLKCPQCHELFPKNDFYKFYLSGLNNKCIFQYDLADRTLLYNTEHPDPGDPLNMFGVDDGEGYVDAESGNRWRFIGTYLIYGQWKKLIVEGIEKLANAYVVTGEPVYAHKAGILLDRIADLYPTFDFGEQGILYEKKGAAGYVSTWHDSNIETRDIALAYDRIFDALKDDMELVGFLKEKSGKCNLENKKESFSDIQLNIESRILCDSILNKPKIHLNFPGTDITVITIKTILGWQGKKDEILTEIYDVIERATSVDGVTGEKGLADYSAMTINKLAEFLVMYELVDENFLKTAIGAYPQLRNTYKFFIDTWCMEKYYPLTGDTAAFAQPVRYYRGVHFERCPAIDFKTQKKLTADPSMYSFIWKLYKITGNTDFVKIIYRSNNNTTDMLPYDITAKAPDKMREEINEIIRFGETSINHGSINKEQWHLAILRSGKGENERNLWLDYDSGYSHGHNDGMNIGLFAKGLDLMPDFGYVPVQFGGWDTPKAKWYTMTAAHNTVVVDGKNDIREASGKTTLWAIGDCMKTIRVSAPELINGQQFERTAALIDISEKDFYVFDVFRVIGGKDHAKFFHSHFGTIKTEGLLLKPALDYGYDTLMRNFSEDARPSSGWSIDWKIEDYLKLLPADSDIHLKYTDLTLDARIDTFDAWISTGGAEQKTEEWIPGVMVRRQAETGTLSSAFAGVFEPYEAKSNIEKIKRLKLQYNDGSFTQESDVAVEISLTGGRRDLIILIDIEDPLCLKSNNKNGVVVQKGTNLSFDGEMCLVRANSESIERVVMCKGSFIECNGTAIRLKSRPDVFEVVFRKGLYDVITGKKDDIDYINYKTI